MKFKFSKTGVAVALVVAAFLASSAARAQREVSVLSAVSALPVASVLMVSEAAGGVAQESAVFLSVAGATLVVKAVESTARGSVYVLERVSDGVRVSVEIGGKALGVASMAVGTVVTVSVIAAGTILLVAGEAIAFVPNEVGRALLYNRRLSN